MRGERCMAAHSRESVIERQVLFHGYADALEHHESGVPFVGVPVGRLNPKSVKHPDPADAEYDLLLDSPARLG